ncbi:MAG: type IX secretion system membrane protein PorP/SprF [Bacteroidota bacterium]
MKIKNILQTTAVALLMLIMMPAHAQQEGQFTQFMNNRMALNPAFAGARGMGSLTAIYRNQWLGFDGAPENKLISFNAPFAGDRVGFGLTILNQTIGITDQWTGSMAYAYNIKINEETSVRFGLQGSMRYLGIDFADPSVFVVDENDASFSDEMQDRYTGNFGVGVYLTFKDLYFGVSVPHMFPNEITFNNQNTFLVAQESPHYYLMTGAMLEMNENLHFRPSLLFKYVENAPFDMDVNLSMVFKYQFTIGASYRLGGDNAGEAISVNTMYQHRNIGIGLAYDYSLSDLRDHANGSLEVLVRYDFSKERDDIENPRFFN